MEAATDQECEDADARKSDTIAPTVRRPCLVGWLPPSVLGRNTVPVGTVPPRRWGETQAAAVKLRGMDHLEQNLNRCEGLGQRIYRHDA